MGQTTHSAAASNFLGPSSIHLFPHREHHTVTLTHSDLRGQGGEEKEAEEPAAAAAAAAPRMGRLAACETQISQLRSERPRRSRRSHHDAAAPRLDSCAAAQIRAPPPPLPKRLKKIVQARAPAATSLSWGAKRSRAVRGSGWRDWANLGEGPGSLIAERALANDVADYVRFRAVCSLWRRCCADPRARGVLEDRRLYPRRWIMLLEDKEVLAAAYAPHHSRRRFLNTSTGHCVQVDVPELRDHGVLRASAEGLILLVNRAGVVRLLNPLTRQMADLPPITGLVGFSPGFIGSCTSSRAALVDDSTVSLYYFSKVGTLAVAKPGDERWVLIDAGDEVLMPTTYLGGRFYGVTTEAVVTLDMAKGPPRLVVVAKLAKPFSRMVDTVHVVDNAGELMLVHRMIRPKPGSRDPFPYKWMYKVYRVDLAAGKTRPRGVGDHAVFIDLYRTVSVSTRVFPFLSAGTIYPGLNCDERNVGYGQIGAYHLRDGAIEPSNYDSRRGGFAHPWGIADCLIAYVTI